MTRPIPRAGRAGFTLLELLAGIAIVTVLLALAVTSVWSIRNTYMEVKTRREIGQLNDAVEEFRNQFGRYPPSKIRLRERGFYSRPENLVDTHDDLDTFSEEYLRALFRNIDLDTTTSGQSWHDWNGNGTIGTATAGPTIRLCSKGISVWYSS
jgi:prepilin-type N-terminal cleavage/methylation domain-containing protein